MQLEQIVAGEPEADGTYDVRSPRHIEAMAAPPPVVGPFSVVGQLPTPPPVAHRPASNSYWSMRK